MLAVIALVIIIFTLMTIAKNTRVKGNWEINIYDETGNSLQIPMVNIRSNTSVGRKKKCFTVKELLEEIACIAERSGDMYGVIHQYPDLLALKLKGVSFGSGCKILNIPKKEGITASCNGVSVVSKTKLSTGNFEMRITPADAPMATFTLRYLGKR